MTAAIIDSIAGDVASGNVFYIWNNHTDSIAYK